MTTRDLKQREAEIKAAAQAEINKIQQDLAEKLAANAAQQAKVKAEMQGEYGSGQ